MSEEATQQAPQQAPQQVPQQQQVEPSFIFIVTQSEAETIVRALDELPGKHSRPVTQKLSIQSQQQLQLIADIAAHHATLPAEQQLRPSTAAAPSNGAAPPSKVRKIK